MVNFPQLEEEILDFWEREEIFKKSMAQREGAPSFVFYEGPPTANGKPGIHHILARSFKDAIPRYKTMRGFNVARKAGWDTHGLPVELEVEKKLGISGKQQIEEYGVEKFNALCRESVWTYKKEWEELTRRMGYWVDLYDPYVTYENDYIESVWHILSEIDKKDLLYLGHRVVPQCPRCGTALSSHEVAQGYSTVHDRSVYVKFRVTESRNDFSVAGKNVYMLAWTTTPWTLPGNVALAVGENIEYGLYKERGEENYYVVAKDLADLVFEDSGIEVEGDVTLFSGKDMVGWKYEPLFPGAIDAGELAAWFVAAADFVTTDSGTGIVHTAVMYGEDDYRLGEELDLPKVHTVAEDGTFLPSVAQWAGRFVKDPQVEKEIITDLSERGLLLKTEIYKHEYPFCWRCKSPLLYYAKNSWFIRMSEVKESLVKGNESINWIPEHIQEGRFGEWLGGVRDWALSRERYWGTPLPVWVCDSDPLHREVIGSIEQLRARANNFDLVYGDTVDLHKPFIDAIELDCQQCDGAMRRVSEVIDVWFDSGAMPFAQHHYPFENADRFEQGEVFPADFISEAIDQTRGWFYTLLAVSTLLGKEAPYKNVICLGHLLDAKGQKMSKSRGNTIDPWEVINQFGVDAVRFFLYSVNQPGESKNFDPKRVQEVVRNVILPVFNTLQFYKMYARDFTPDRSFEPKDLMDRWVCSQFEVCREKVTDSFESYDLFVASRELGDFAQELSTWYVRMSRDRAKRGDEDNAVLHVLHAVLLRYAHLIAPLMPFFSEYLYRELSHGEGSVHLQDWPEPLSSWHDENVLSEMQRARKVVEMAHALRDEAGQKLRQPLAVLNISVEIASEYLAIIADETNVKEVVCASAPDSEDGWFVKEDGGVVVALDTRLSDELRIEGRYRELVRALNAYRKKKGLKVGDMVSLQLVAPDEIVAVVERFKDDLLRAVQCSSVNFVDDMDGDELAVDSFAVKVLLS